MQTQLNGSVSSDSALAAVKQAETKKNSVDDVASVIKLIEPQIKLALPKQFNAERFGRVLMTTIRRDQKLIECLKTQGGKMSLMGALITAAQLGLEPGILGQCYLIPYGGNVEFQLGYKGMIDLARRSGNIQSIDAECVYDGDEFEYSKGLSPTLVHKPKLDGERGNLRAVYAVARFNDGGYTFVVLGRSEVMRSKACSKSSSSGSSPWAKFESEMWLKSAIKKLFKFLPISTELASQIQSDQIIKNSMTAEVSAEDVINVDFSTVE